MVSSIFTLISCIFCLAISSRFSNSDSRIGRQLTLFTTGESLVSKSMVSSFEAIFVCQVSTNQTKTFKCSKLFLLLDENVVGHVWICFQLCHLWHCQLKKKYFFAGNELGITQLSRRRGEKQPRKKSPHRCITAIRVANFFRWIKTKNFKG